MNSTLKSNISEWRLLKEICTPDLYFNNVFRVTGLAIETSLRTAKKYKNEILQRDKLGLPIQLPQSPIYRLPEVPSAEKIRLSIEKKFFNPHKRILEELFWFWPMCWKDESQQCLGIDYINSGKIDEAVTIWKSHLRTPPKSIAASHNIAVYHHMMVLDLERKLQGDKENPGLFNQDHASELLTDLSISWKSALTKWHGLWVMDDFWHAYLYRINEIDKSIGQDIVQFIRHQLPVAILSINARFTTLYGMWGDLAGSKFHLSIIMDSDFDEKHKIQAVEETVSTLTKQIHRYSNITIKKTNAAPNEGLHAGIELLDKSRHMIKFLLFLSSFKSFSMMGRSARDSLSEAALDAFIAYGNTTDDWKPLVEPITELLNISHSTALERRINQNLETISDNAQAEELDKELKIINDRIKIVSSLPDPATRHLRFTIEILPKLDDLKRRKGDSSRIYNMAADLCAVCLRGISVELHNKNNNNELALKVIHQALNIAKDSSLVSKLQTDKSTVERFLREIQYSQAQAALRQKKENKKRVGCLVAVIVFFVIIISIAVTNPSSSKKKSSSNRGSSSNYKSRFIIGKEIEAAKNTIKGLEAQISNMDIQLQNYQSQMDNYDRRALTDDYNALVPKYNDLVNRRNTVFYKYKRLLTETNNKVDQYNRMR